MTKGAMTKALAEEFELKQKQCSEILESFVAIATTEVKKNGIFTIPGLCRIKTRVKPATKAGIRNIFGKDVKVAAKPAKTKNCTILEHGFSIAWLPLCTAFEAINIIPNVVANPCIDHPSLFFFSSG